MSQETMILGFDWGMKRIGTAIGNSILGQATPLKTLLAQSGLPDWNIIEKWIKEWRLKAFVVGVPTKIDGQSLYTTELAQQFCALLEQRFHLPVYPVDERLTTVEARQQLFEEGGYRKIQSSEVDSYAARLILEQWFFEQALKNK